MMPREHATVLLWALLAAALGGVACGWLFGERMLAIAWIGALFLDALKMTIIPLLIAAVVSGVASLAPAASRCCTTSRRPRSR